MTAPPHEPPDIVIADLIRNGSIEEGVCWLVRKYERSVKGALLRKYRRMDEHEVEDAFTDAILSIANRIDAFDPNRGSLGGWLRTSADRNVLSRLRVRPLFELLDFDGVARRARETRSEWMGRALAAMRPCIAKLSERQQDLIMRILANTGESDREIAEVWETTEESIRSSRLKAKTRLGQLIEAELQ